MSPILQNCYTAHMKSSKHNDNLVTTLIATAGAEYTDIADDSVADEPSVTSGFKCKFMSSSLLSASSELSEPYP